MINNRYIIEKLIGEGRSKVFLCRDTEAGGKKLAIKILIITNADEPEIKTFREEYYILKRLNHPNIIQVYDSGNVVTSSDEEIPFGCPFFTMDYFSGTSLDRYQVDPEQIQILIIQICSVLFYLHQSNYVYYDLKPENILVDESQGKPDIKFIDFGLAEHLPDMKKYQPKGTAQYIAPEILKKQPHDFRVDIYSLGILIYKLVYQKFPFHVQDELLLYKAHLETDFDFPEFKPNGKLPVVLRKALAKDPSERYDSVLKILVDLNIPVDESLTKDFIPAKVFANRRDVLAMLKKYISDESSHEVFSIRGYESMGKTFLAEELTRNYDEAILINQSHSFTGIDFIRSVMRKIYYHRSSFERMDDPTRTVLNEFVNSSSRISLEELKKIFHQIATTTKFILVLDGFNIYDEVSQDFFKELIPVLQVNKRKVILTEESEMNYTSGSLNNLQEINISPFTEADLTEYLIRSFYSFYPIEEIRKLILRYADLLPGSIDGFIKDVHLFGVITYKTGLPVLETSESTIHLLRSSHNEIYEARLKTLSDSEIELVQLMSLFEFPVSITILRNLMSHKGIDEDQMLSSLEKKNIIQHTQSNGTPVFSASSLKKYIYATIKNASELHGNIAFKIRKNKFKISNTELSRQFELAGLFDESYETMNLEIESAELQSAYSYQKQLLIHLLELPLSVTTISEIKYKLCKTLSKLNDHPAVIKLCTELEGEKLGNEANRTIRLLKAKALYGAGELSSAKEILNRELDDVIIESERIKIIIEIAYIEYDLTSTDKAKQLCEYVLLNQVSDFEDRGKAYNLIGLIAYSNDDDFDFVLDNFKQAATMYEKAGQTLNQLKIEINIGNILFLRGNSTDGMMYWLKAKETNLSVGNMEYEALIIMNLGAYDFNSGKYEEAEVNYLKASGVFVSIGNKLNYCSALINLSEIYIETCAFDKASKCLLESNRTLFQLDSYELEAETKYTSGKYFFYLGDDESLNEVINEYEKVLNKAVLSDKYYNSFNSLKLLMKINLLNSGFIEELNKVISIFAESDDKYNYLKFTFILISYLIKQKYYKETFEELNKSSLIKSCAENMIHEAERLYWMGILADSWADKSLGSPNQYLEQAYEIIENQSITDLTWKILFALAGYYKSRGNDVKFYEYLNYTKSVLNFLIHQIKNVNLRSKFLNKQERKSALKQIDIWESKT